MSNKTKQEKGNRKEKLGPSITAGYALDTVPLDFSLKIQLQVEISRQKFHCDNENCIFLTFLLLPPLYIPLDSYQTTYLFLKKNL